MLAQHAGARFIAASLEPEPGTRRKNHAPAPIPAPCRPRRPQPPRPMRSMLEALRQAALDGQMRAVRLN